MKAQWIPSWTAAPMNVWAPDAPPSGFCNQTVREIARVSLGGSAVRVKLTNEFGSSPIRLDAVEVAMHRTDGQIDTATTRQLTFSGLSTPVITPGAPLLSDAVEFSLPNLSRLAVSYYARGFLPVATYHLEAQQSAYISSPGNFVNAGQIPVQQVSGSHYLLSAIYVETSADARAIVCFGDSITDGFSASIDVDRRWPDILAERVNRDDALGPTAVLNQGIGGNRLLHNARGVNALQRFDRDVLSHRNATHVFLLAGINDIIWPGTILSSAETAVPARSIIAALDQLISRARLNGIKVIIGTLLPFENAVPDSPDGGFYTAAKESIRQAVNQWIRTQRSADVMVDFDAVMQDPDCATRLRPDFDSGDHIHPNDAGYRAMADAIDLSWLGR